jgi:hypothetical protein
VGEEQTTDEEIAFVKETKVLEGLSVEDREDYVYNTMESFSNTIDAILKVKGQIKQGKRIKALQKELGVDKGKKGAELMVCGLYAVKKRYRPLFVKLLAVVSGIKEDVFMPGQAKK